MTHLNRIFVFAYFDSVLELSDSAYTKVLVGCDWLACTVKIEGGQSQKKTTKIVNGWLH